MLHKSEQEIRVVLYKGFFSSFQGLEKMEFSNTQSCEKPSDFDKKKIIFFSPGKFQKRNNF